MRFNGNNALIFLGVLVVWLFIVYVTGLNGILNFLLSMLVGFLTAAKFPILTYR